MASCFRCRPHASSAGLYVRTDNVGFHREFKKRGVANLERSSEGQGPLLLRCETILFFYIYTRALARKITSMFKLASTRLRSFRLRCYRLTDTDTDTDTHTHTLSLSLALSLCLSLFLCLKYWADSSQKTFRERGITTGFSHLCISSSSLSLSADRLGCSGLPPAWSISTAAHQVGSRIDQATTRLSVRLGYHKVLGGSWDLVSKVISPLIGVISSYKIVISIVTLFITLVTKSHDPKRYC